MAESYVNRYGRRGGRGARPWLILGKAVCVGLYLGALAAALVLWQSSVAGGNAGALHRQALTLEDVSRVIRFVMIPSLVGAMVFGLALLAQMPRVFLRMRWLALKLVAVAIIVPAAHFHASSRMHHVRASLAAGTIAASPAPQFTAGLALTLAGSIGIIALGRLKPRLGRRPELGG